jgi:hypothetical protein
MVSVICLIFLGYLLFRVNQVDKYFQNFVNENYDQQKRVLNFLKDKNENLKEMLKSKINIILSDEEVDYFHNELSMISKYQNRFDEYFKLYTKEMKVLKIYLKMLFSFLPIDIKNFSDFDFNCYKYVMMGGMKNEK